MNYGHLPEEFHFSHNFCFFLHDQLVATLKDGEEARIFDAPLINDSLPPENLSGELLLEWLNDNEGRSTILELYYKQITAALLSDMLHFLYEALQCSAKGKITVAFALLRKPLKENLLYLEWLLADPQDMLSAFEDEKPKSKSINKLSETRKKEIIDTAMNRTNFGSWIDADFIYDLRYNKTFSSGFEDLFQKANHLVTTFNSLETEPANFNFVFSNEEAHVSQWQGLYSYLPPILFHAVEVVDALIGSFAKRAEGIDLTPVRNAIGLAAWFDSGPHRGLGSEIFKEMKIALQSSGLKCPSCSTDIFEMNDSIISLYSENSIACSKCDWSFDLNGRAL